MSSESSDDRSENGDVTEEAVLNAFKYDDYQYRTEDIARSVGAPPETVEPILTDLERRGDLSRTEELQATLWEIETDAPDTTTG